MLRPCRFLRVMTPRVALRVLALDPAVELTPATVKKAYIRQTLECHPDLHPNDPDASEKFRTLSDALRVALTALQTRGPAGVGASSAAGGDAACDPQAALEALRRAIVAYHDCQNCDEDGTSRHAGGGEAHAAASSAAAAFFSPSLEHVSRVCHDEAVAMRRVHSFCAALPAVLCGAATAALFEAVAFFHVRYVQSTASCVLRFSKNLPVIVRRVVQQRKKSLTSRHDRATAGLATGTRPRLQRIEDMAMKPLVLMGALVFDVPGSTSGGGAASREVSCNVPGIAQLADIRVTPALRCVIDPADSIGEIVAKLSAWEAASFDRLKLELAIVDVCRLLAGMLGLDEAPTLAVMAHLAHSNDTVRHVLLTLQKLACDTCLHFDDSNSHSSGGGGNNNNWGNDDDRNAEAAVRLAESVLASAAAADTEVHAPPQDSSSVASSKASAQETHVPALLAQCRTLAMWARRVIVGNIDLTWDDGTPLVTRTSEVQHRATPRAEAKDEADKAAGDKAKGSAAHMRVVRHPGCSVAEEVQFAVSVPVCASLDDFLRELRRALATVVCETHRARAVLHELLPLRDALVAEEFIAEAPTEAAAEPRYRHRGPIQCFPRLYNMCASKELKFWRRLHALREHVAQHAPAMSSVNLYCDCMPYRPHERVAETPVVAVAEAGWVGEGEEGCDSVVITSRELDDALAFRTWLEDVIECCTLSKEAQRVLYKAGVGYVSRDDALPLANFLSFVKLFVAATAVRAVLEQDCGTTPGRVVTSQDVGLSIVVSNHCDVREGGKLYIPWYVDPSILLSLLDNDDYKANLTLPD